MNSYRTVTKQATPGASKKLDYVVNIYHNGRFKFAYRFKDWSEEAVDKEVGFIRNRFSDANGFLVKW
jgi:hypothetical protein